MLFPNLYAATRRGISAEPAAATAFLRKLEAFSQPQQGGLLDSLLASFKAPAVERVGRVAVIPFKGFTGFNLSPVERAMGMVDVAETAQQLKEAQADPEIAAILFDVNSPGGYVTGVTELSRMVSTSKKPIETWGTSIHSAAYHSTGVARRVWGIASGDYGSIGSMMVVEDISEAAAKAGIKVHVISSGWAKGMLTPGAPVTDEQLSFLKDFIKEDADDFKGDVRAVRTTVPEEAMQGQYFTGKKAAALGLLTGIASKDEVLARLNSL